MKFLERFKELLDEKNYTITDVAQLTQIPRSTISSYVNRKSIPSATQLDAIASLFGCTTDYLLGREDDFGVIVSSKNDNLTREERELLAYFNEMDEYGREAILIQVKALAGQKDKVKG